MDLPGIMFKSLKEKFLIQLTDIFITPILGIGKDMSSPYTKNHFFKISFLIIKET